jgi:hypothetical protein
MISLSVWGALTAFFWAALVRVALLHRVSWSINSICHMFGQRPFASRDKATYVSPLAIQRPGRVRLPDVGRVWARAFWAAVPAGGVAQSPSLSELGPAPE